MNILEIVLIGVGLAMDAFAVSICKGLSMQKMSLKKAVIIAVYFGGFQALMPVIGYFLGSAFSGFVGKVDHWIAFGLLAIIGINMIVESFKNEENKLNDRTDVKTMLALAVATSIDALAVGITFALFDNNIFLEAAIIGVVTFIISFAGVKIGNVFGDKWGSKAEFVGGCILILIGLKILLEHLGLISF